MNKEERKEKPVNSLEALFGSHTTYVQKKSEI